MSKSHRRLLRNAVKAKTATAGFRCTALSINGHPVDATDVKITSKGPTLAFKFKGAAAGPITLTVRPSTSAAAAPPPARRTLIMPPKSLICRFATAWPGWSGSPG